ncbi:hypothetical protein TNIN_42721 [Trichonephila inaurata madagascariensis]|uniref:Uncharacterized protein n=1 Tax=Trichonephila inaurata madagascariensis TaxID=2747483 RepID=A0A8X6INZ7_9ARAC|nr:hypothetical protein TNIN_42721 [Trichonephila inaurata madagascariensis]
MCFIDSETLHFLQQGGGSPNRRCLCVRRSLVHVTCSRQLLDDGTVGTRTGMTLCNLFLVCWSQFDCHTLCSFCLKQAFRSECEIGNLSEEPVTERAAVSASSFPVIPACPGIQQNQISFFLR